MASFAWRSAGPVLLLIYISMNKSKSIVISRAFQLNHWRQDEIEAILQMHFL